MGFAVTQRSRIGDWGFETLVRKPWWCCLDFMVVMRDNAMVKCVAKGNGIDSQGGGRRLTMVVCANINSDSAAAVSDNIVG